MLGPGWRFVPLRLLCLIMTRVFGWLLLLRRSEANALRLVLVNAQFQPAMVRVSSGRIRPPESRHSPAPSTDAWARQ